MTSTTTDGAFHPGDEPRQATGTQSERHSGERRSGEIGFDGPAPAYDDAGLVFIGRIHSPWSSRAECPKNMRAARDAAAARGMAKGECTVVLDPRWRLALTDLAVGQPIFLLSFLDRADREIAVQMPRHAVTPRGTFSLRSPVRPNPIGLHLATIVALDIEAGRVVLDAIDVLDDTPLLDIKPYFESVDRPPA